MSAPELLDCPPSTLTPTAFRGEMMALTRSVIARVQANTIQGAEAEAELASRGITLRRWAEAIDAGLNSEKDYIRLRSVEELRRFYETTGEQVQLIRAGLGMDTGPAVAVQVNTAGSLGAAGLSPEAVRILNAAARHPEVWEAYSAAMEREGEQAK